MIFWFQIPAQHADASKPLLLHRLWATHRRDRRLSSRQVSYLSAGWKHNLQWIVEATICQSARVPNLLIVHSGARVFIQVALGPLVVCIENVYYACKGDWGKYKINRPLASDFVQTPLYCARETLIESEVLCSAHCIYKYQSIDSFVDVASRNTPSNSVTFIIFRHTNLTSINKSCDTIYVLKSRAKHTSICNILLVTAS